MSSVEKFVYDHTGKKYTEIGEIVMVTFPILQLLATRSFLTQERLSGKDRRHGQEMPHLISAYDQGFIIDGHHKIRRALDEGKAALYSKVLITTNASLIQYLYKINQGYIQDLSVVNK